MNDLERACSAKATAAAGKKAAPQFRNEIRSRQQQLSEVQSRRYKINFEFTEEFLKAGFWRNKKYQTARVKKTVNFGAFLPHFAHPFHAHKIDFNI